MIKSKEFERVLTELVESNNSEWDLKRLEQALMVAKVKASAKRFKLLQADFKLSMGGK